MAKKTQNAKPLTLQEIILRGEADVIRQALEARVQIDQLLEEREAAYQRIAELETQVSEIVGEDGVFPFPTPPLPVADYPKAPAAKKKATTPKPAPKPVTATTEPDQNTDTAKKEADQAEPKATKTDDSESESEKA